MPVVCSGASEESGDCDCTLFVPNNSKKPRCKGCGHRRNDHKDTTPLQLTPPPSTQPRVQNTYISRLARKIEASAVHQEARREALQGYRPVPRAAGTGSSAKGKGRTRQPSTAVASNRSGSSSIKFGRVVFFPCGSENLQRFTTPTISSAALEAWINAGLATEADSPGFVFELDWGTKEFNGFLRGVLPALFAHFDSTIPGFSEIPNERDTVGIKKIGYSLPYSLLEKRRKTYRIIDIAHPLGKDYDQHLAGKGKGAGFRAKSLFFVTKDPIPQDTINKWFHPSPAPKIPANVAPVAPARTLKRRRSDTISVSSEPSEGSEEGDTDTDVEDVKVLEPPKKRAKRTVPQRKPPSTHTGPEFVEGSSRGDARTIDGLAKRLQQSASFQERPNPAWASDEESDLWKY